MKKENIGYVVFLSVVAAIGGILFGYDTAVISGTTSIVSSQFGLDTMQLGWYVGCALIGSIAGVASAGVISDRLGRKKAMLFAAFMFSLSAIGCAICNSFTELVIYRIIGGVGIYGKIDVNELRRNVGMVFQKPNPFPMSVYDNVAYGPRTLGVKKRAELDEIVEKSLRGASMWEELKDRLGKSALGLSGGQQQRLCIARALATDPKVLLMDEPTSALDPISTGKIEELVEELEKDTTIVIVTHNMQQATRIADKTAFFLLGELVEFDDTEKIFSSPADKRTENYITGRFG